MASREDIIFCDRCGAEMKKNQRCCIKCGNINYSNPENASMRKFENNSKKVHMLLALEVLLQLILVRIIFLLRILVIKKHVF